MPRIEIKPSKIGAFFPTRENGNPTMDVCFSCIKEFPLGPVPYLLRKKYGDKAKIVTIDCEHPPYNQVDYDCDHCGMSLLSPEDD